MPMLLRPTRPPGSGLAKASHHAGKSAGEKAAGNGSSGTGKAEGILVAEVLLLLLVGRSWAKACSASASRL